MFWKSPKLSGISQLNDLTQSELIYVSKQEWVGPFHVWSLDITGFQAFSILGQNVTATDKKDEKANRKRRIYRI